MALDISGLTSYTQDKGELVGKSVQRDTVLRLFVPHIGYLPGAATFRIYQGGGDLKDCCVVPTGSGEFIERLANIACIESGNEFCLEDLAKYIRDSGFRVTAGSESAGSVEQVIMNQELAKVSANIDKLVFQGDTASSDTNLNKFDGLIKQATAATDSVKLAIATGNVFGAIQQVIGSLPYEAMEYGEIGIMVGYDVASRLRAILVAMNLYHTNPTGQILDSFDFPGQAGMRIIPTRGLNGTGQIIATPLSNVHWLTNKEDDYLQLYWGYSEYHQVYYWRIKFLLGVTFGMTDQVVIATLDPAVIAAAAGVPVSIVSPLNATGDAVQTEAKA